jgi:hypothetical protein
MTERSGPVVVFGRLVMAGLGLLSSGCAEELGPVPLRVAHVRGWVRQGDRPVPGGWIEFYPVDGTVGNPRSARLHQDGSFQADRVAVGVNLIRIVNAPIEPPAAARLFAQFSSPIRRTIPERSVGPLSVDLVEEAVRFQKTRSRGPVRDSSGPGESP